MFGSKLFLSSSEAATKRTLRHLLLVGALGGTSRQISPQKRRRSTHVQPPVAEAGPLRRPRSGVASVGQSGPRAIATRGPAEPERGHMLAAHSSRVSPRSPARRSAAPRASGLFFD